MTEALRTAEENRLAEEARLAGQLAAMDLQWFAKPEDEGRTEDPTERKIRESREEGKVAKSSELVSSLVMILPFITIAILSGWILTTMMEMISYFLSRAVDLDITSDDGIVEAFLHYYLTLTAPVFLVAFISAVLGNLVQVGFLFTTKTITPDFQKISPNIVKWATKSLFSMEALFNLAKSLFKVGLIGVIAYLNIRGRIPLLSSLIKATPWFALQTVAWIAFQIMIEAAVLMLVLAIPDYLFQRHQHRESLKMTKHEVKEEHKQEEGDPMVKSRLRQRMQQILSENMVRNVPDADVVITNPTHFAVALQYDGARMQAPTVIAKGQDSVAQQIKRVAGASGIPLVENKPLARGLHASVEIGDEIPEEYWTLVSEILAEIYRMAGKGVPHAG